MGGIEHAGGLRMVLLTSSCLILPPQEASVALTQRRALWWGKRLPAGQLLRPGGDETTQLPDPR